MKSIYKLSVCVRTQTSVNIVDCHEIDACYSGMFDIESKAFRLIVNLQGYSE